jgi:4-alpha-glucanotransferase
MTETPNRRRAGLLIPLFAAPSTNSWGVGEIGDLPAVAAWLARCGHRVLQLLPLNEMAPGEHSPYSAISAMAVDPIFISVPAVPEFELLGGTRALSAHDRETLAHVSESARIRYAEVRELKRIALAAAFNRFFESEWRHDTARSRELKRFVSEQGWWIDDYATFRAIHECEQERPWTEWAADLQRREPTALKQARRELSREVLFQQYLQWIALTQWQAARAKTRGVEIFGDLPFMVDGDSADVWAHQEDFRLDVSLGVPPDAFSATGQDWGMPVYRWDAIAADDFRWLRDRARRSADLYDGYRIDHLVGFYRTYGRPRNGDPPFFSPSAEADQKALGERVIEILRGAGAEVIAEDLGTVPDFVRESLVRLAVPGFRVFRWERNWKADGQPFREPTEYPPISVATSGTHDTEPQLEWWEHASPDDREKVDALPTIRRLTRERGLTAAGESEVRDVLLEALFASGSNLLLFPVQDIFGWRDRINEPATVTGANWTFRLPWPSDRLDAIPGARERQARLRQWSERYGRL